MNPFEMVVAIIAITAIASVVRAKYGATSGCGSRRNRDDRFAQSAPPNDEADRLRAEVKSLKERVAVLERLATDHTSALDREFERLKQQD